MIKKVTFLLPRKEHNPVGGYKVVYEYANRLAEDNYAVNIVYPEILFPEELSFWLKVKCFLGFIYYGISKKYKCSWFPLKGRIKEKWVFSLNEKYIPESDVIVATSWGTAEYLAAYTRLAPDRKFYLIQGYENWDGDEERLLKTWKASMQKIVIAPWLQAIAGNLGEKSVLIENGFNFDYFRLTNPVEKRDPYCLCMLNHHSVLKGCADGLKAIELVRAKFPGVRLNLFGVPAAEESFPEWITYYQMPDKQQHNALYNEAAIFVAPSHTEGFSLTPPEAMQCGCAVVCTDIGGYTVVCHDEETALVSPVKDVEALAGNIIKLIEDQALRIKIARQGHEYIQQFTWNRSYQKLKTMLDPITDKTQC